MEQLPTQILQARGQLNTCAELSRSGRRTEAYAGAGEVHKCITTTLLPQALQLSKASNGSKAFHLVKEVRMLQVAAVLAQALDAPQDEKVGDADTVLAGRSAAAGPSSAQRSLYVEAKDLAESFLPPIHPMVALTRSLCDDRGVSAGAESGTVTLPALAEKRGSGSPGGKSSPSNVQARPKMFETVPERSVEIPTVEPARAASPAQSQGGSSEKLVKVESMPKLLEPLQRMVSNSQDSMHDDHEYEHDEDHIAKIPRNIFAEYIADYKLEKEMGKPWFNDRQDDMRKHVFEQARFVRLQNLGKDVNELANPKFTALGHKISCKVLTKDNTTRSEPALLRQVKMAGVASPEAFMTSKLRLTLDPHAKPMVQPKRKKREYHD